MIIKGKTHQENTSSKQWRTKHKGFQVHEQNANKDKTTYWLLNRGSERL